MGVPGFFLWLLKKYKKNNFVLDKHQFEKQFKLKKDCILNNIDDLLIDANCLIHPECFKVLAENKNFNNLDSLENKMLIEITNYLKLIINYVQPKKTIYIAIDGVAPVAKIKQQRSRRFKSYNDYVLFNNIKKK